MAHAIIEKIIIKAVVVLLIVLPYSSCQWIISVKPSVLRQSKFKTGWKLLETSRGVLSTL